MLRSSVLLEGPELMELVVPPSSAASLLTGIVFGFARRHLGDAASGAPQAAGELSRADLEVEVGGVEGSRSFIIM